MTKPTPDQLAQAAKDYTAERGYDRTHPHTDLSGPTVSISMRLPQKMLAVLKALAAKQGMGYQTLMKQWLEERIRVEALRDGVVGHDARATKSAVDVVARMAAARHREKLQQQLSRIIEVEMEAAFTLFENIIMESARPTREPDAAVFESSVARKTTLAPVGPDADE